VNEVPLSLYVHFPWCVRKCPYCDFNSHPLRGDLPADAYVARLLEDLASDTASLRDRRISTVFLGGGTPSLLPAASIQRLLDGVRQVLEVATDAEITIEANPGTIDEAHFAGYAAAGVNRISIGAQSFDAAQLERLGRIHAPEHTERAVTTARQAGLHNINLDLMHGLPGQSVESALDDLERAISLGVDHISWYQLTLEPRTPFAADPPQLPDERTLEQIESKGLELLARRGFERYEISAFARPGARSRHNLNYWTFGDYIGIGAGAHGKITWHNERTEVVRTEKPKAPDRYLRSAAATLRSIKPVSTDALPGEFMMNALRLIDGVPIATFEARTGLRLEVIAAECARQRRLGTFREDRIGLTRTGLRYLDSVVAAFL